MAYYLGIIRFKTLHHFAKLFNWLIEHFHYKTSILTFKALRWLWELVSPSEVYRIVSFDEYAKCHKYTTVAIKTHRVGYAANAVSIGKGEKQIVKEAKLADLNLYCLEDVCVHHGSDLVANVKERLAINDYCATNKDENKGYEDKWCYLQVGKIIIARKHYDVKHLDSGVMLLDKYSFNYYHNMYENLIRLCVLDEIDDQIPFDVPLMVDEDVVNVPSFKRLFEILTDNIKRQTIIIKKDELVSVGKLFYITPVNNLVANHKDYLKGLIDDYIFDKEYILKLRDKLFAYKAESKDFPKRIFITRKNTSHRHFNEDELFAELEPYGFKKIAPEEYSFEQQMAIFNNAEWIIGGSGAALTNLLFVSPLCIVVCLYRNSAYIPAVFTAPVCFNEAKMYYFQSSRGETTLKAHTDFTINQEDFRQFVNDCIYPLIQVNNVKNMNTSNLKDRNSGSWGGKIPCVSL